MINDISARLQSAVFAGYLYLIGIVIMWSSFRTVVWSARDNGIEKGNGPVYFVVYTVMFAMMAVTFVLFLRGYRAIAEKYQLRILYYSIPVLMTSTIVLPILILFQIFDTAFMEGTQTALYNGIIGIVVTPYGLIPLISALSVLSLRAKTGYAYAPLIGFLLAIPAVLLGHFFWTPIAEGIFVISGILLFRALQRL